MEKLLEVVLPVALIVMAGYAAGRAIEIDLQTLSRVSVYLLVPALIFDAMLNAELTSSSVVGIWGAFFLSSLLVYLVTLLLARAGHLPASIAKTLVASAAFPNSGNMGLALSQFAFGKTGLELGVVFFIASSILMFGLGPAYFRGGGFLQSLVFTLRLPLFWSLFAGLVLRFTGWSIPFNLGEGIHLLGQAAIPLMLATLGMQIAKTKPQWGGFELTASTLRLGLSPLAAFLVAKLIGLGPLETSVLVLQSAMPIAVNAFLMAQEFGGDAARAARAVVASSVLSFATIPLLLWLLRVG